MFGQSKTDLLRHRHGAIADENRKNQDTLQQFFSGNLSIPSCSGQAFCNILDVFQDVFSPIFWTVIVWSLGMCLHQPQRLKTILHETSDTVELEQLVL